MTLMNAVFNFVLGSLCLSSLCGLRGSSTVLLSKVSSLFVLTHFLLIVHDTSAIQSILTPLFFGDENDIRSQWVRSVQKGLQLQPRAAVDDPQDRFGINSWFAQVTIALDSSSTAICGRLRRDQMIIVPFTHYC